MTVQAEVYRYTGAAPGSGAKITNLSLGAWDSNATLQLYPIKRGSSTAYSYVAALALYMPTDPGNVASFRIWPVLSGGSLDANIDIKIATQLVTTYIRATGVEGDSGTPITTLYAGSAVESLMNYSSGSPKIISGSDLIITSGVGRYTKYILIQAEFGASAPLGAAPATGIELKLHVSALESPA